MHWTWAWDFEHLFMAWAALCGVLGALGWLFYQIGEWVDRRRSRECERWGAKHVAVRQVLVDTFKQLRFEEEMYGYRLHCQDSNATVDIDYLMEKVWGIIDP